MEGNTWKAFAEHEFYYQQSPENSIMPIASPMIDAYIKYGERQWFSCNFAIMSPFLIVAPSTIYLRVKFLYLNTIYDKFIPIDMRVFYITYFPLLTLTLIVI